MEYLFIYGVFMDYGKPLLKEAVFCDKAYVYGKLYKVNEFYPGYILESCDNKVWGDVYLINPDIFPILDEFEGSEYTRRKIYTSIGEECWIYEYTDPIGNNKEIESGNWMLR